MADAASGPAPEASGTAQLDDSLVRLRRIEGQVRGLQAMLAEGRDCVAVLTQFRAVRSALDEVGARLIDAEIERCLRSPSPHPEELAKALRLWLRS